jgi:beta-lactamase superfamily II metal-dependent hydrolase
MDEIRYAAGPVSFLFRDVADGRGGTRRRKVKQLLWGDWVRVTGDDAQAGWKQVSFGRKPYLMRAGDLRDKRVLEIIFLDVGQGDGAILTEPGAHADPRIIVIDAGAGDNMARFLHWRFKDFPETGRLHGCIITHSDKDHYGGFRKVFADRRVRVGHLWHNGIIERAGDDLLGPAAGGYLTDIRVTHEEARALLDDPAMTGSKQYPATLKAALERNPGLRIEALTALHGARQDGRTYVPGFTPDDPGPLALEVLGPVPEPDAAGRPRLRQFGASGAAHLYKESITKNGHSVLIRGDFNGFRFLLGGDLNRSAERFLLLHYGGAPVPPPLTADGDPALARADTAPVVDAARARLAVDLMKACHHGSADVSAGFARAVQPAAFVISSGDAEGHVHPRPDLLGLLGKAGRGERPLLLATELLRSTRERGDPDLADRLQAASEAIATERARGAAADQTVLDRLRTEQATIKKRLTYRNVGVYGAINLRTDGETAVIAFLKEAAAPTERWFSYVLKRDPLTGAFAVADG